MEDRRAFCKATINDLKFQLQKKSQRNTINAIMKNLGGHKPHIVLQVFLNDDGNLQCDRKCHSPSRAISQPEIYI